MIGFRGRRRATPSPRGTVSRELVVHVGLPKTATTTIQTLLSWFADDVERAGVACRSIEGHAAHHILADQLLRLDGRSWPEMFHHSPWDLEHCWPEWGGAARLVVSAEDLCDIGPLGVAAVDSFADRHDASITVVATLRSPIEWSWSLWTEHTKSRPVDWIDFVEDLVERRRGVAGEMVAQWSAASRFRSMKFLDFHVDDPVMDFLDQCVAPGIVAPDVVTTVSENVGVGALEAMYRARYVGAVLEGLAADERFAGADPDGGLVPRLLLNAAAWSSPMSMTARAFAPIVDALAGRSDSPFGPDSLPVLRRFGELVEADAIGLAADGTAPLDDASRVVLRGHADRARGAVAGLIDDGPMSNRYPQRDFASRLPVDERFDEAVEQTVGMIVAGVAVVDRTYRTTRRRHG